MAPSTTPGMTIRENWQTWIGRSKLLRTKRGSYRPWRRYSIQVIDDLICDHQNTLRCFSMLLPACICRRNVKITGFFIDAARCFATYRFGQYRLMSSTFLQGRGSRASWRRHFYYDKSIFGVSGGGRKARPFMYHFQKYKPVAIQGNGHGRDGTGLPSLMPFRLRIGEHTYREPARLTGTRAGSRIQRTIGRFIDKLSNWGAIPLGSHPCAPIWRSRSTGFSPYNGRAGVCGDTIK